MEPSYEALKFLVWWLHMTRKFHGKQRKISVFVKRFEIETDNLCKLDQMVKLTRHENDNRANSQTKHPLVGTFEGL